MRHFARVDKRHLLYCVVIFAIVACKGRAPLLGSDVPADAGATERYCVAGSTNLCIGDLAVHCAGGETQMDCRAQGQRCNNGSCSVCSASDVRCDGETIMRCQPDGMGWERGATCDGVSMRCSRDGCVNLCAHAADTHDYIGCEYWPVTTRNQALDRSFEFAVVVGNGELVPARVQVFRGDTLVRQATVAPGQTSALMLPWVEELAFAPTSASVVVANGAYRVVSDVPVTAHQYNPLTYSHPGACSRTGTGTVCYSYTNDASLLLPTAALTGNYVAMTRPTHMLQAMNSMGTNSIATPGFLTVVATQPDTVVTVTYRSKTNAGTDLPEREPGSTSRTTLQRGDVLQVFSRTPNVCPHDNPIRESTGGTMFSYCDPGREYDLTGTEVRADKPVVAYSGHDCTFIPFHRFACDHLEEQLFPVETWGRGAIAVPAGRAGGEPTFLRVVSASSTSNTIQLSGDVEMSFALARGEFREVEIRGPVRVTGSAALQAGMFMVGQNFRGNSSPGSDEGDPAFVLVAPPEQWRMRYTVLLPGSYQSNRVLVARLGNAPILIDGIPISGLRANTNLAALTSGASPIASGTHIISSTQAFGLSLYALAPYTSYWLLGGMSLEPISEPLM